MLKNCLTASNTLIEYCLRFYTITRYILTILSRNSWHHFEILPLASIAGNVQNMKPVHSAQVSYFGSFSEPILYYTF